jgi:hypothetical protein
MDDRHLYAYEYQRRQFARSAIPTALTRPSPLRRLLLRRAQLPAASTARSATRKLAIPQDGLHRPSMELQLKQQTGSFRVKHAMGPILPAAQPGSPVPLVILSTHHILRHLGGAALILIRQPTQTTHRFAPSVISRKQALRAVSTIRSAMLRRPAGPVMGYRQPEQRSRMWPAAMLLIWL